MKRIIAEKVLNLGKKETVTKVQEIRVPYGINPKRKRQRYTVIKMTKTKDEERILTAAMEKQQINTSEHPYGYQFIFQQKLCRPEGSGMIYLKG